MCRIIINMDNFLIVFCSIVLGMEDGSLTVLTIADPKKGRMSEYLKALPSRNRGQNLLQEAGF